MKKSTLIPLLVALAAVIVLIFFISANGTLKNEKKALQTEADSRVAALQTELDTAKTDAEAALKAAQEEAAGEPAEETAGPEDADVL